MQAKAPPSTDRATGDRRPPNPGGAGRRGSSRLRLRLLATLAAGIGLLAVDLRQPPARQLSARLLLSGIDLYQATLSEVMPAAGVNCRFEPTCSRYAEASIRRHGALVGSWRGLKRIARCGPWTPMGTVDPP